MSIKLVTDSAADFDRIELEKYSIECVPLMVSFGSENYIDGINLNKDKFYHLLQSRDEFPKTSQPAPAAFQTIFEEAKENGDTVIAILLSSALSGTYQSALIAKDMVGYESIYLFDTRSATGGEKIYVAIASQMIEKGYMAEGIVRTLESMRERGRLYAALDTLEYLCKGGRLSRTAAGIGTLARLKPIITLTADGEVTVSEKCIGRKSSLEHLVKYIEKTGVDTSIPISFVYSHDKSACEKVMANLAGKGYDLSNSIISNIGPTIGAHIGVGAVGIIYFVPEK
ncbi:Protein DegV [bioreactor metagenome]|uniref:Protein DegV n=1 Tax=bioreactor metagenome TaxID=1076179 RepID=A0A645AHX5_9ZZZZ|nr:DegV family protein [Candidatus Metalachnospira sp.]